MLQDGMLTSATRGMRLADSFCLAGYLLQENA